MELAERRAREAQKHFDERFDTEPIFDDQPIVDFIDVCEWQWRQADNSLFRTLSVIQNGRTYTGEYRVEFFEETDEAIAYGWKLVTK